MDLVIDSEKHAQVKLYNKYFLNKIKMDNWVIVCDLDEFIYSRNDYNRIIDYLNTVPENINIITDAKNRKFRKSKLMRFS